MQPQLFRCVGLDTDIDDVAAVRRQRKWKIVAGKERRGFCRQTARSGWRESHGPARVDEHLCPGPKATYRPRMRRRSPPTEPVRPGAGGAATSIRRISIAAGEAAIERNWNSRSFAVCHRSSGSLARHRESACARATGTSGTTSTIGRGSSFRIALIRPAWLVRAKRTNAGDHFVGDRAERKDVRPGVSRPSFELFGRDVLERAQDRAFYGERFRAVVVAFGGGAGSRRVPRGQPEIQHLHARLRQHDVAGLQVSVDDPAPVCSVERVDDLDRVFDRSRERQRSPLQPLLERLTIDVLHDQVVDVVLHPDVVERADVRMIQAGDDPGFALEACDALRVVRQMLGQRLDGDGAVQARIDGAIHLTHAARGDQGLQLVRTEDTSDEPARNRRCLEPANRGGETTVAGRSFQ